MTWVVLLYAGLLVLLAQPDIIGGMRVLMAVFVIVIAIIAVFLILRHHKRHKEIQNTIYEIYKGKITIDTLMSKYFNVYSGYKGCPKIKRIFKSGIGGYGSFVALIIAGAIILFFAFIYMN